LKLKTISSLLNQFFQEQNKEEIEKNLEKFILDYISRSDKLNTLSVSDTVDSDATLEGQSHFHPSEFSPQIF